MAEERTLGLARAQEQASEDLSKEELQRRLDDARDSISHTVTEIKESVESKVQAVKETLDWREQFKKRPVAWSAGALGVGFVVGYSVAALVKSEDDDDLDTRDYASPTRSYAAQPVLGEIPNMKAPPLQSDAKPANGHDEASGPGFFQRVTNTAAYERVRQEAGGIGEALIQELSKTAKQLVLPAIITSVKNFIGGHLPGGSQTSAQSTNSSGSQAEQSRSRSRSDSNYQPVLERNQG